MTGEGARAGKSHSAWEQRALDRVRERALQRGHKIVEAASELVAEGGLEALTLRALLEKTKLARRAFYSHFDSMDDVLLAVFENTLAHGATRFREDLKGVDEPLAALELLVRTTASGALASSQRVYMLAMTRQHVHLAERRPDELREALAPMTEVIEELLSAGMVAGVVRQTDPHALAELLHALIATQIHRNLYRNAEDTKWIDELWDFCFNGVRAR